MVPMFALIATEAAAAAAPAIAAGLTTGTMAGTMLGTTGATLGTTAGLGAAGTAAGAATGAGLAGTGAGALSAGMTGAALTPTAAAVPEATALASSAPQLTSLAQASPEIAANLAAAGQGAAGATGAVAPEVAAAGQGIMQGVAPQAAAPLQAAGSSPATTAGAQNVFGTASFQPPVAAGGQPGFGAPVVTPSAPPPPAPQPSFGSGIMDGLRNGFNKAVEFAQDNKYTIGLGLLGAQMMNRPSGPKKEKYGQRDMSGFTAGGEPSPYMALGRAGFAEGGPVEAMSTMNAVGGNPYYPMSQQPRLAYANPGVQNPISQNVLDVGATGRLDPYTGMPAFARGGETTTAQLKTPDYRKMLEGKSPQEVEQDYQDAKQAMDKFGFGIVPRSRAQQLSSPATAAQAELEAMLKKRGIKSALPKIKEPMDINVEEAADGGIMYNLGGYSDGGRLLKGPGDGVSDSIPASIGGRQPARLADGEFVVPARIVSELGNGSTEAGARKLYAMMDRVQKGRKKSIGKGKVAVNSKADKHLPA